MDLIKEILMRCIGVLRLDENAIKKVIADKESFRYSIWIVAVFALVFGFVFGMRFSFGFAFLLIYPVMAVIASFIFVGVFYFFARIFGGKGSFVSLYSVVCHAFVINIIAFIPYIGMFA